MHPVDRCRVVDRQRRFVERDLAYRRKGQRCLQRDDRSRAQAENVVRSSGGENRVQVLALGLQAVVLPGGAAASASAAIGYVHREVGQRLGEPGQVLRRLRSAVHRHDAGSSAELAIADRRSVAGNDRSSGIRASPGPVRHVRPVIAGAGLTAVTARPHPRDLPWTAPTARSDRRRPAIRRAGGRRPRQSSSEAEPPRRACSCADPPSDVQL